MGKSISKGMGVATNVISNLQADGDRLSCKIFVQNGISNAFDEVIPNILRSNRFANGIISYVMRLIGDVLRVDRFLFENGNRRFELAVDCSSLGGNSVVEDDFPDDFNGFKVDFFVVDADAEKVVKTLMGKKPSGTPPESLLAVFSFVVTGQDGKSKVQRGFGFPHVPRTSSQNPLSPRPNQEAAWPGQPGFERIESPTFINHNGTKFPVFPEGNASYNVMSFVLPPGTELGVGPKDFHISDSPRPICLTAQVKQDDGEVVYKVVSPTSRLTHVKMIFTPQKENKLEL